MKILVDADACPVIRTIEMIAKKHEIPVILICDINHALSSDYSEVKIVDYGPDSVDFALLRICTKEDIVVTQDYGLAALILGKGAHAIHQSGRWYTNENIDQMLLERHIRREVRRTSKRHRVKGLPLRSGEEELRFRESFEKLIVELK